MLSGKTAIVTGASRGLGKAIAIELARAGAKVAIVARTVEVAGGPLPGSILETTSEIEELGGRALPVQCDITREDSVQNMVRQVRETFGPVEVLVNNAGVTSSDSFLKTSAKRWDLIMAVNVRGAFLCTKAVLPEMVERAGGHILNVSSVLATKIKFNVGYGTSKAAIERFTLGLAEELRKFHIGVNALCPDFTKTEAVVAYLPGVDASRWQSPQLWGKYAVRVAAQDPDRLTGRILTEKDLNELFGQV
jgi:citronellol/citronellal dehydrogenase